MPEWVSPNLMTFIAFAFVVTAHAILYFDSDKFEYPSYSRYALILFALFIFFYHIIDSSDGKQARKLKNSTALGMILDHGLDSISITLIFMPFGQILGMWDRIICVLIWFSSQGMYFMFHEEYFTHKFLVPGGGDETISIIQVVVFITAFLNRDFW